MSVRTVGAPYAIVAFDCPLDPEGRFNVLRHSIWKAIKDGDVNFESASASTLV